MRRLLTFTTALALSLCVLEGFARHFEPLVVAVANRVELKAAMFERQPETQILYIGTSRFNDGIAPKIVSAVLGDGSRGFNASTPSSSLQALTHVVKRAAGHAGLKVVLLEISDRQIHDDPGFTVADDASAESGDDAEGQLQQRLSTHSSLMRHRRAWVFENVPRWGGLLFAPLFDGSEWFRTNSLLEALRPETPIPTGAAVWQPALLQPSVIDAQGERIATLYAELVRTLQPARVVLVAPPVAPGHHGGSPEMRAIFAAAAERAGAQVWDYASLGVPLEFFHDGVEHLSDRGRVYFSTALAMELAR